MKHLRKNRISIDSRHVCLLAVFAAVMLAFVRMSLTPVALLQPTAYRISLWITAAVLVVILALCVIKQRTTVAVDGVFSLSCAIGAAITGSSFLMFSIKAALNWQRQVGVMPFPSKSNPTAADQLFFHLLVIFGILAGVFFIALAVCWLLSGYTRRGILPLLCVTPVVWSWVRIIRYITSYASLVGLFHNLYDLATVLCEMVFFLLLTRYVSGESRKSRFFTGVALCTGVLCVISCVTQVGLFLRQDAASFETCALVTAPDFGVALFAFAVALAQSYATAVDEERLEQEAQPVPEQRSEEDEEDGEGAEFLISETWFAMSETDKTE